MKKITDLLINNLVIDPSIEHKNNIDDLIRQLKIDIISHKDNEQIMLNLYYILKDYFSVDVVYEVLSSALTKDEIKLLDRDYKLKDILKK